MTLKLKYIGLIILLLNINMIFHFVISFLFPKINQTSIGTGKTLILKAVLKQTKLDTYKLNTPKLENTPIYQNIYVTKNVIDKHLQKSNTSLINNSYNLFNLIAKVSINKEYGIKSFFFLSEKEIIDIVQLEQTPLSRIQSYVSYSFKKDITQIFKIENHEKNYFETLLSVSIGIESENFIENSDLFKSLGLSHLVVASGANVFLLKIIVIFFLRNTLGIYSKKTSYGVTLFLLVYYIILLNFDLSIIRAGMFFMIEFIGLLFGKKMTFFTKATFTTLILNLIFFDILISYSFILSMYFSFLVDIISRLLNKINLKYNIKWFFKNLLSISFYYIATSVITLLLFNSIFLLSFLSQFLIVTITEIVSKVFIACYIGLVVLRLLNLNLDLLLKFIKKKVILIVIAYLKMLSFLRWSYLFSMEQTNIDFDIGIEHKFIIFFLFLIILIKIYSYILDSNNLRSYRRAN